MHTSTEVTELAKWHCDRESRVCDMIRHRLFITPCVMLSQLILTDGRTSSAACRNVSINGRLAHSPMSYLYYFLVPWLGWGRWQVEEYVALLWSTPQSFATTEVDPTETTTHGLTLLSDWGSLSARPPLRSLTSPVFKNLSSSRMVGKGEVLVLAFTSLRDLRDCSLDQLRT